MNLAEIKFSFARNVPGGGSVDLGEVWDALGNVLDTIDELADKLINGTNYEFAFSEELNMIEYKEGSVSNDQIRI